MTSRVAAMSPFSRLSAFADDESKHVNVVIETPQGSRNKFNYEDAHGVFKLGGVLPAGAVFPFDFGFVPATLGGDGDPLDVLVLMDEPAFAGCLIETRLIGVIEAEQTERDGERTRNDRLVGIAVKAHTHQSVRQLGQLDDNLVAEIEHFFVSYNQIKGKTFEPLGRHGARRARTVVEEGVRQFTQKSKQK